MIELNHRHFICNLIYKRLIGKCSNPFTLTPSSSCLLSLNLDGSQLPQHVISGPEICKTNGPGDNTPSPFLCSQPSAADSLNILVIASPTVTLTSIMVTPVNPSIASVTKQQFTATGTYSDTTTQDITASVIWGSSDTNVATISNTLGSQGLATGIASGDTTITATQDTIAGNTTLTVTTATLQSINVTPTNALLSSGATLQFTAIGTYSDSTTQNITTSVTWSSSDTNAATISNTLGSQGLATSINVGSTIITANQGMISDFSTLTIFGSGYKEEKLEVVPENP